MTPRERADKIIEVMKAKKISQVDLAKDANLNKNTIAIARSGDRSMNTDTLQRIAKGLGIDPKELI